MIQLSFYFREDEREEIKNIVRSSVLFCKNKYPKPVEGESVDEYKQMLRDEILLEIADRLQKIVYDRQNREIAYLRNPN